MNLAELLATRNPRADASDDWREYTDTIDTRRFPMRAPSKAALALAMGVFTASGASAIGVTAAIAAPSHAHSATTHDVSTEVPGTGVDLTDTMDDNGAVTGTTAGDDDATEVANDDDATDLGDQNDPAEPAETEHHDGATTSHDDGQDTNDNDGDGQDANDNDQGDDNNNDSTPTTSTSGAGSSDSGDSSGDGGSDGGSGGSDSGSGDGGSGDGGSGGGDGGSDG